MDPQPASASEVCPPLPDRRTDSFLRQNCLSAISYDIYRSKPEEVDLDAIYQKDVSRYTLFKPLPGTHMYASFGHLAPYSSAYYTYVWDKVIAEDFFHEFDQHNLLA